MLLRVNKLLIQIVILALLSVFACAQDLQDSPQQANLILQLDELGNANISFNLTNSAPLNEQQIQALSSVLGFKIQAIQDDEGENQGTETSQLVKWFLYYGKGVKQFHKDGLRVNDNLDLAPLLSAIKGTGIQGLQVTIAHPESNHNQPLGGGSTSNQHLNGLGLTTHQFSINGAPQKMLRIEYGYSTETLFTNLLILILVLATPAFFTAFLVGSLLQKQKQNPQEANLASLGIFNLVGHLTPILWWVAIYYTKATDLLSPWLHSQSPWVSHPTRLAIYSIPPILVSLVCNAIYQIGVAKLKHETRKKRDLLKQAALNVMVTFVPMLSFYNGIFMIIRGEIRQAVFFFVVYVLLQSFCAKWQWQALGFTPYILPNGLLRHRIHALANQAGIKLQQIFLIADRSGQTANAFAASGNNLMLTEFLLERFTRREIDFIASHEISHLQLNHTSKKSLITLITFPIMIIFAVIFGLTAGVLGQFIPAIFSFVGLHGYPLILIFAIFCSMFIELFISRRFEYQADAAAIRLTGDPEAAVLALARLGKLNFEPMQWGKLNGKFLTHPSIYNRVQAIAKRHQLAPDRVQMLLNLATEDVTIYSISEVASPSALLQTSAPANQTRQLDLPQGKQIPLTLAPVFYGLFGISIAWLLTTPDYSPQQFLDKYQIPSAALLTLFGILFAGWKSVAIKSHFYSMLAEHVIFNEISVLESPTITTVVEMDEIMHFTNELKSAGFIYAGDYQVITEPRSRAMGFVRVFIHPVYKCYAEVAQIVNVLNRPRPIGCTIISDFGEGYTFSTSNREYDGVTYALRTAQGYWNSNPHAHPVQLLEMHLEQREQVSKQFSRQIIGELSATTFQAIANTTSRLRKANFKRKNIIQFILEADFCSQEQKRSWFGKRNRAQNKAKDSSVNPALAPRAKA